MEISQLKELYKPRKEDSHKGDFGHSFLVAGSKGRMGAAVIASRACLRAGTGLLTVLVPEEERMSIHIACPEAMLQFREASSFDWKRYSAIGIGPAMGTDLEEMELLEVIIANCSIPIVIDADALTLLSTKTNLLLSLPKNSILTPHPKEFDRLFGEHYSREERIKTALEQAKKLECIIVLKGADTIVTNGIELIANSVGNAGLAKGGSGDALTGIITALLAQQYDPFSAAKLGVYLHGKAADLCLETQSKESMLISDVIEKLGKAFETLH